MPVPTALRGAANLGHPAQESPPSVTDKADLIVIDSCNDGYDPVNNHHVRHMEEPSIGLDATQMQQSHGIRKSISRSFLAETRKVSIPPHRMSPLKSSWPKLYTPLVQILQLQVRMNIKAKVVELKTSPYTENNGSLQKGEDFVTAFALGFEVDDAVALLRLDDLYIETFEIKDVKSLTGDHLSRAIGRIAGKDGKTKFAVENASRTRVVLADQKIHILGGFKNIHLARESIVSLILGSPPSKVYGNLRVVANRLKERS